MTQASRLFFLFALAGGVVCTADTVQFQSPPAVARSGDKTTIAFALSAPTDVEVAVLDGRKQVVRHLAAGVLGGSKPPPAPLQSGLVQSVVWDGKDDFGKAAGDGSFHVRVRAGMDATFGRFVADDPYTFGGVEDLCSDETGTLYVMGYTGNRNQNMYTVRAFDAQGNYLRQILPFAADLAPDSMQDIATWDAARKSFHPRNLSSLNPTFYADALSLVSASTKTGLLLTDGTRLYTLELSGAVRGRSFTTCSLWEKALYPWGKKTFCVIPMR